MNNPSKERVEEIRQEIWDEGIETAQTRRYAQISPEKLATYLATLEEKISQEETRATECYEHEKIARAEERQVMIESFAAQVKSMMDDPARFPADFWNEQEQGAYKALEDVLKTLEIK